jgi:hypothetical protein
MHVEHTPEDTAILNRTMDASTYLQSLWESNRDAAHMLQLTRCRGVHTYVGRIDAAYGKLSADELAHVVQF